MNDSLIAYYNLSEAGNANALDRLGVRNMTSSGTTPSATGIIGTGRGAFAKGANNYFSNCSFPAPTNVNYNYTINLWLNLTSVTTFQSILTMGLPMGNPYAIEIGALNSSHLQFNVYTNDNLVKVAFNKSIWNMVSIVMMQNETKGYIYLNGQFVGKSSSYGAYSYAFKPYLQVGVYRSCESGYTMNNADQTIVDELAIFNRSLSANEIYQLWNNGQAWGWPFTVLNSTITSPTNSTYSGLISINYTAPVGNLIPVSYYNLSLYNSSGLVSVMQGNNSLNLSYLFNSFPVATGLYFVNLRVYDTTLNYTQVNSSNFTIITGSQFNNTLYLASHEGCNNWTSNINSRCSTADGRPIIQFNTSLASNCSIRNNSTSVYNASYKCETTGNLIQQCTLFNSESLVYGLNNISLSCNNLAYNINVSSTALSINMTAGMSGGSAQGGDCLVSCISYVGSGCAVVINNNCSSIYKP